MTECNHVLRIVGEYQVQRCMDCDVLCIFKIKKREGEKIMLKEVAEIDIKQGKITVKNRR